MRREVIGDCELYCGDAMEILPTLPAGSAHCCVTSPPYWGLRDYKLPPSIWGGGGACNHQWAEHVQPAANGIIHEGGMSGETLSGSSATRKPKRSNFCERCGAWHGCLGLEPTPDMYVANMVSIFRAVRRILRDDGTLWLNLGDSYNAYNAGAGPGAWPGQERRDGSRPKLDSGYGLRFKGLKPKDLIGIPWRVAIALQADGWFLRSDIIWHKPNPMPESVTDRPTKSHEYVFLLSKQERYFYDCEAIKEPAIFGDPRKPYCPGQIDERGNGHDRNGGQVRESVKRGGFNGKTNAMPGRESFRAIQDWRNKRSVWTVTTTAYPEAHFATFPPALIEPCIKAGAPLQGIVLDPFIGSGTTAEVATLLGRGCIGCEMNPEYFELAIGRTSKATEQAAMPLFEPADYCEKEQPELFGET